MSFKIAPVHETESMSNVYADALLTLAARSSKIVVLEADLMACVKTERFMKTYPERIINCGVQEANMIGVAAGLSAMGFVPYVHTFGCFASRRCYDQIFISGAYARLNIRIIGSDPGVYSSYNGGTHMPFEDGGIIRNIPNAVVMDLTDAVMARDIFIKTADLYGVYYMRYPRKASVRVYEKDSEFTIGKGCLLREGRDATVIASGLMVSKALEAAETLQKEGSGNTRCRYVYLETNRPRSDYRLRAEDGRDRHERKPQCHQRPRLGSCGSDRGKLLCAACKARRFPDAVWRGRFAGVPRTVVRAYGGRHMRLRQGSHRKERKILEKITGIGTQRRMACLIYGGRHMRLRQGSHRKERKILE